MSLFGRHSVIVLAAFAVGAVVLFRACRMSVDEIRATEWKYADEESDKSEPAEFFHFESRSDRLVADTIYKGDRPIALLLYAYHKYDGTERLFVSSLASGREVEYINF